MNALVLVKPSLGFLLGGLPFDGTWHPAPDRELFPHPVCLEGGAMLNYGQLS